MLGLDDTQMSVQETDRQLPNFHAAKGRDDLPIEPISVCLQGRRATVRILQFRVPLLGDDRQHRLRVDGRTAVDSGTIPQRLSQLALGRSLCLPVTLDWARLAIPVSI
jgi:hypothetical protein